MKKHLQMAGKIAAMLLFLCGIFIAALNMSFGYWSSLNQNDGEEYYWLLGGFAAAILCWKIVLWISRRTFTRYRALWHVACFIFLLLGIWGGAILYSVAG